MLWRRRDEKSVMDLRRLCCVGPCACGGALVVPVVLPLRSILANQAGLVIGWRTAAMPSNVLAKAAEALRGKLLGKEQAALFRRHRRSQGRRRQPQEAVSKETPGG